MTVRDTFLKKWVAELRKADPITLEAWFAEIRDGRTSLVDYWKNQEAAALERGWWLVNSAFPHEDVGILRRKMELAQQGWRGFFDR
jgi:hypothetical protein